MIVCLNYELKMLGNLKALYKGWGCGGGGGGGVSGTSSPCC